MRTRRDLEASSLLGFGPLFLLSTSPVTHAAITCRRTHGRHSLVIGVVMRSDKIHKVLAQGINRFEVCQLVSKGVRATHKLGGRFEDTINDALDFLGNHKSDQKSLHPAPKPLKSAA
jgi:hypothetical protein